MINKLCWLSLIITNFFYAAQINDSTVIEYSHLNDSAKVAALLDDAWKNRSNEPLTAIKYAKQAKHIIARLENKSLDAKADNYLGIIYTNIGAIEIALDYHLSALKKSKETDDKIQLAYSYNNIGGIFRIKNDFISASENISTAIKIFKRDNYKMGLAFCFINLGRLYKDNVNFEKSLYYLEKALVLSNEIKNEDLKPRILLEKVNILFQREEYDQAEITYLKLEELYKNINYLKGLAEVWGGLSELHFREKKFNDALNFSQKALTLNKQIHNAESEVNNLNKISLIYLALNQLNKGENYLAEALNKSYQINEPDLLINTYKTHYEYFKKTGNLKQSLYYYEKYNQLNDSVYTTAKLIKFGELESLFRLEKTEKENQILINNLDHQLNQRNYLLIIIILFVFIVAALTIRYYEKKKLSEKLKQTNIVKDKFFRIIAHDLREPFNAIFSAVELLKTNYDDFNEHERKEIIDTIGRLVKTDFDLLENLLMWSKNQSSYIEFNPENLYLKEIIRKNINLVQNNISKKNISIKVDCPDDFKIFADEQMLNSILRNIIFNSVKFTNIGGEINVSANIIDNKTKIEIADNGTGMSEEIRINLFQLDKTITYQGTAGESGSGIGLILTKEFVDRHNGSIDVISKPGEGSKFTIIFPIA